MSDSALLDKELHEELDEVFDELADLPTDQYYIRNSEKFAGRNHIEDRSLLPKKVDCPNDAGDQKLFKLERLRNGRYKIYTRPGSPDRDPTKEIHNLLFALLIEEEKAEEWIITKRGRQGHRLVYTIQTAAADRPGWVKQFNVDNPQIAVRHLIATKSIPPHFEKGALWNIQPLVD